jgi:hypothetical protein
MKYRELRAQRDLRISFGDDDNKAVISPFGVNAQLDLSLLNYLHAQLSFSEDWK